MEDNISFEDEVNSNPKTNNFTPSASATAGSVYDIHNNNNTNHNFGAVNNNNNNNNIPASGICQEQTPAGNKQWKSRGSECAPTSAFPKGCMRREKESSSWLTRSVTQPNLGSRADAMSINPAPPASTQSEESVLRIPDNRYATEVTTSNSTLSSCPSSYEGLSSCPSSIEGLSRANSSEYFDAKSSLSAPVELLSEFLSALMSRHYEDALNLCLSILKYEPQNATALEFYPLLLTKIKQGKDDDSSSSDDDTDGDSDELEATDKDDDDEDEAQSVDNEGNNKEVKEKMPKTERKQSRSNRVEQPRVKSSFDGVVRKAKVEHLSVKSPQDDIVNKAKGGDKSSVLLYPPGDMSTSNSMDFSVEIDSGRESLFTPSDSDLNLESGDSLYSSTDSNLNMVRSGSDSLFSSTDTGLTLETVIKSIQNLGGEYKKQAVK